MKYTLKRLIDHKPAKNLNFGNNLDGLLTTGNELEHFNNSNFLCRFSKFLQKHKKTLKLLNKEKYKNLIIAFTHIDEWQNRGDYEDLLHRLHLPFASQNTAISPYPIRAAMIILVFSLKPAPDVSILLKNPKVLLTLCNLGWPIQIIFISRETNSPTRVTFYPLN